MKIIFKKEKLVSLIWFIPTLMILIFMPNLCEKSAIYVNIKASFFPNIVLTLQLFFSIMLFFESIRLNIKNKKASTRIDTKEIFHHKKSYLNLRVIAIAFLMLIYIFLVYLSGFIIASFSILFLTTFFLGYKNILKLILICFCIIGILYFLFTYLFLVSLPTGILFS